MAETIRILIADDHPVVREGLEAILSTQKDFQVVGEASSGDEVVEKAEALRPDVILLDLEMPGLDGVEALQQLQATNPGINAIVFTAYDTDERILGAVKAGAKGYLLKGVSREVVFNAIREVKRGGTLLQPLVATKLLRQLRHKPGEVPAKFEALTDRERQVLSLLAQGKKNKEIAYELVISERTVKFHVSSILRKLGAGNRTEAVTVAASQGIIQL